MSSWIIGENKPFHMHTIVPEATDCYSFCSQLMICNNSFRRRLAREVLLVVFD